MMNKNLSNKGQTLVLFVVLLPVFLLMAAVIVDLTMARSNKIKLDNITKEVVRYGVKHINNNPYDDMVKLIYKNDDGIDRYEIEIDLENKKVNVKIEKNSSGIFSRVIGKERYKEKSNYVGYMDNNRIIIKKGDE